MCFKVELLNRLNKFLNEVLKSKKIDLYEINIDPEGVIILNVTTFLWMNKFRYVCGKKQNKTKHTKGIILLSSGTLTFRGKTSVGTSCML